jgi:hypothetical protein
MFFASQNERKRKFVENPFENKIKPKFRPGNLVIGKIVLQGYFELK